MERIWKENSFLKQIFFEITGSIFIAAGIYNFAVQAEFPMSGFSGIAIIFYRLWHVPIGLSTIALNIPVAILCYRLLGRRFFVSSIRCMVISSIFIDYVAPLFPVYGGSRMLAALCTGVMTGIGYTLIYIQNTSTGGMDFIIMAVKKKIPHLSLGKIVFLADMGIVVTGGILLRDMDGIIYGMIVNFLLSTVMDKLMYGINAGKMSFIITNHAELITKVIDETCQRGSTVLKGAGGYQGDERQVVLCACSNKDMYLVQRAVKEADPASFMIVMESSEVHGEGFRHVHIG